MESLPTSRLRAMLSELAAEPRVHFDALAPTTLGLFLAGYTRVVPCLHGALVRSDERTARELHSRAALGAAELVYLTHGDTPPGYRSLLQRVGKALPTAEQIPCPPPDVTSFRELLPTLNGQPAVLLGEDDAARLAPYLAGLHRGLIDRGIDPSHDRALLGAFEAWLQQEYGFVAPWHRLLHIWCGGTQRSASAFAARYAEWQSIRGDRRAPLG
jgi:hypothetical protein